MQLTQFLRRAAQIAGTRTAVVDGERSFDWDALLHRVSKLAGAFRQIGTADGDRIALIGHNSHRSIEAHFAALWAGGVVLPVNHRLAPAEMAAVLQDADPALALVDSDFRGLVPSIRAALPQASIVVTGDRDGDASDFERLIEEAKPVGDAGRGGDDAACLYYTGGTTGRPKGVVLTHHNVIANAFNFIAETGIDDTAVHLHCGPWYHVAAGARIFLVTLLAGRHVVLPRFSAASVLSEIARSDVTLAGFVPTMAKSVLDELDREPRELPSLRWVTYGAAPMPEELVLRMMRKLPGVRFLQLYGQTELSPVATLLGPRYHVLEGPGSGKLRSAGKAALSAEVRIVDESDQPLPPRRIGEIAVRGPMVMREYWRQPELTAHALRGGWMHTGDAGYLDDDGFLFVVDRLKDMIITGGENVYSIEVENAIYRQPSVSECAVFGIPDATWGEAVHAVVVPLPGTSLDAEAVKAHCKALIAAYKCPRSVEIRAEPLPLTGAGKILKSALRDPYWRK